MPLIQWEEAFSVGNEEIDAQHQKWIDIYNDAHDKMIAVGKKDHRRIGSETLAQMLDYARQHFEFEEAWMSEINYPDRSAHKELHWDFLKQMEQIQAQFNQGNPMLNSELIKLIENWLLDHILKEDRKYAEFSTQAPPVNNR